MLSASDLLAGSALTFAVEVPARLLALDGALPADDDARSVRLRPLSIGDLQLLMRAAEESDSLLATLMVQRALVEPQLTVAQVATLPVGLAQFLLTQVNEVSGISAAAEELAAAAEQPLVRAAFALSREFGWTPQQIGELTLGQILLHLQLLGEHNGHAGG